MPTQETSSEHVGTYLSFATAQAVPLAEVERCLKAHRALDWEPMAPSHRTDNARALWSGEGKVTSWHTVGPDRLIIQTERGSGETHVSLASEPVFLA
jgi:hypothetical protein